MRQYVENTRILLSHKRFLIAVLIVAIIAYGFAATNIAISIDDLQTERYVGSGHDMLQAGRFGMNLTYLLRGGRWYNSYSTDIFAVVMLLWAALSFSVLFRRCSRNQISVTACTAFSCVLISYPLMNEIWEYTGANAVVCVGFLLDAFALLMVYEWLHNPRKQIGILLVAAAAMMWVCAGYESLAPVYIFSVFAILALQIVYGNDKEKTFVEIIRQGMVYAAVLLSGIILRLLVHKLILAVTGLEPIINGSARIYWMEYPPKWIIVHLLYQAFQDYILYALVYFPITEFVVCGIVFVVFGAAMCKKYGKILLLPIAGMLFSLFVMSLVWGDVSPYRTCQVFAVFVAFTVMIILHWLEKRDSGKKRWLRNTFLTMALFLSLFQAIYLNYFLTLNYLRSEEEAEVVRNVGLSLASNYSEDKPVAFVGEYELSDSIVEQASISEDDIGWKIYNEICERLAYVFQRNYTPSRKIPNSNINSVIAWSIDVSGEQTQMFELFRNYGYDFKKADHEIAYGEAIFYAMDNEMPSYPRDGYIVELEDYIIVRLGKEIPSYMIQYSNNG